VRDFTFLLFSPVTDEHEIIGGWLRTRQTFAVGVAFDMINFEDQIQD